MIIQNRYNRTYNVADDDIYWQKMLSKGIFQINNIRMLHELRPKARTIIDIGANIGTNSIEYGTWAQTVHSFEPTPELFTMLVSNVKNNKQNKDTYRWHDDLSMNITADMHFHNYALGNKNDTVYFKTFTNNKGKNHVTNFNLDDNLIQVPVKRLDDLHIENVDVIKIDVEGYELFVLQGAEKTILRDRPVIQTEMHQGLFKRQNCTIQDIAEWLYERDYICIDRKNDRMPRILPTNHSGMDLFWIKKFSI